MKKSKFEKNIEDMKKSLLNYADKCNEMLQEAAILEDASITSMLSGSYEFAVRVVGQLTELKANTSLGDHYADKLFGFKPIIVLEDDDNDGRR